jgi:hypothetical protein
MTDARTQRRPGATRNLIVIVFFPDLLSVGFRSGSRSDLAVREALSRAGGMAWIEIPSVRSGG